jgi:restriction system protein
MAAQGHKVRTPLFPDYSTVRHIMRVLPGERMRLLMDMMNTISGQTGTPQDPVDWTEPDQWIDERLTGNEARLAQSIWHESNGAVNPRHVYGSYLFLNNHDLWREDSSGVIRLTERGQLFLSGDRETVEQIDDDEGIAELLRILATKTRPSRSDVLPEWREFLAEYSKFGTTSTITDTLRRRISCLIDRGLLVREGRAYSLTDAGKAYAGSFDIAGDPRRQVMRVVDGFNDDQREVLRDMLADMDPNLFEHLVRELLEAMGYEDVTVTKQSGDKGVDVVATVQFGITDIREVVQVKRHQANIRRPTLDQLRGALPYHGAIRGTLITIGQFSSGCTEAALFPGAAPITLIDGDRLLDLLTEHEVAVRARPVRLYEVDQAFFDVVEESDQMPPGASTEPPVE